MAVVLVLTIGAGIAYFVRGTTEKSEAAACTLSVPAELASTDRH